MAPDERSFPENVTIRPFITVDITGLDQLPENDGTVLALTEEEAHDLMLALRRGLDGLRRDRRAGYRVRVRGLTPPRPDLPLKRVRWTIEDDE